MMDWQATLKTLAPTVASAFLGPLGGVAVAAVGNLLGVSEATQDKIADVIKTGQLTPEQIGKIKELELQYQDTEKERGFRYAELAFKADQVDAQDRDSARKMQTSANSLWPGVLSAITTAAVIGVIALRMFGKSLPDDPTTIQLIGSLTTGWGMALAYWFGTTRSSSEKNAMLAQSQPA
jgi:hypothetical protein